jgi:DNA invertase Pin-like site-specific DNA recombinase
MNARKSPAAAGPDLSPKQFRDALLDHGFAWLTPIGRYIDIRQRVPGRYLAPVKDARGRILRTRTLAALLAARAEVEAAQEVIRAANARRQAIAAKIAPHVLPPCRADLTGTRAIAQLADDFILGTTTAEGIDFKSLINKGWSASQLREHAEAARAVADRKQVVSA